MKLSALRDNIITEKIKFREHEIEVSFRSDVYTTEDAQKVSDAGGNNTDAVIEYVLKGVHSWDIQDENDNEIEKTLEAVKGTVPELFLMALYDAILTHKKTITGKFKTLKTANG